jgi:hypothetical protein
MIVVRWPRETMRFEKVCFVCNAPFKNLITLKSKQQTTINAQLLHTNPHCAKKNVNKKSIKICLIAKNVFNIV